MSFRRTRRRAGYAVCQYNIQTWDWSVLNRKVRADFIWQQGNRADVSLFYIFTKQQAWPWWPGTQERGACASQLAEHKERSAYHVNVQSDGEVSVSPVRQIPAVPFYLAEGCGIPAPGSRAPGRGAWWISHGAGRLCLAAGLSEWRWAQEGASLCNVPPLPAEIRPGQSNERTLNREDSSTPLGERGRTDKAGVTFSKNMTSYSTEVRLRCRGASQETERLLSSLCVRINWDTVTGAAGGENRERQEEIQT